MSSYLNFYLVPKKGKGATTPLHFISYSSASDIYQYFRDSLNVTYIGNEGEDHYTELTKEKMELVLKDAKEDLEQTKHNFEITNQAYKDLCDSKPLPEDAIETYVSTKQYIEEMEASIHELEAIAFWVSDLEYSDFEKILINID